MQQIAELKNATRGLWNFATAQLKSNDLGHLASISATIFLNTWFGTPNAL